MNKKFREIFLSFFPVAGRQYRKAFSRKGIAKYYLKGNGIEIGGLHNPLETTSAAHVKYVDRLPMKELQDQYPEISGEPMVQPDIIDDGETLETIPDGSQDFIIANHFLEHTQNPILTIINFFKKLKPEGIIYLAVPDKRFTFDHNRPVTNLTHLLKDYEEGPAWSRPSHYEEWVKLVEGIVDKQELEKRVSQLMEKNYSIHFHAWTQAELFEFFTSLQKRLNQNFDIELSLKSHEEIIFVLKKP